MTTLRAGSATSVGQVRSINQDSFLLNVDRRLYGVADGIGGHQGGEVASALAVEIVDEASTEPSVESLVAAVTRANRMIFEKAGSAEDLHGMGTTFVAIQVVDSPEGEEIGWVNVGDSRLYLLRDDEVIRLTQDHSLVEELLRDGQITEEEAKVHPQRNIVTRSLGIDLDVTADAGTILPFTGDRYLLCSDGLSNEVTSEQMASVLRRLADPDEAASELVRMANEHGGRDNITVVIVDVLDDGGRAERASEILAAQAASAESVAPPDPRTEAYDDLFSEDSELFPGRASSLPSAADDYATDIEDPYDNLKGMRTRRITWRVIGFFVLLALIAAGTVAAIGWTARNTYFVTFNDNDRVTVYQGKPGGILFFDPKLLRVSDLDRADVGAQFQDDIESGKTFGSEAEAESYVASLAETATTPTEPTTTTTTAPVGTTTTVAGATTTAPTTTSTPPAGP